MGLCYLAGACRQSVVLRHVQRCGACPTGQGGAGALVSIHVDIVVKEQCAVDLSTVCDPDHAEKEAKLLPDTAARVLGIIQQRSRAPHPNGADSAGLLYRYSQHQSPETVRTPAKTKEDQRWA